MKGTGQQVGETLYEVQGFTGYGQKCFVSGHDFSRAINARLMTALAAEVRVFNAVSATKNRLIWA
jgi:hypothetical protein